MCELGTSGVSSIQHAQLSSNKKGHPYEVAFSLASTSSRLFSSCPRLLHIEFTRRIQPLRGLRTAPRVPFECAAPADEPDEQDHE